MASALLGLGAELLGGLEGGAAAAGAAGASEAGAAGGMMSEVSGLLDKGIQFMDKANPFLNILGGLSGSNLAPPELRGHDPHPDQYNWE